MSAPKTLPEAPSARRSPPPPHAPDERELIARLGEWELRDFAVGDVKRDYFAGSGFAHVQLWHPGAGVSILTPSRLTNGLYEVFPLAGWKHRELDWRRIDAQLRAEVGVRLPSAREMRLVERWFIRRSAPQVPLRLRPVS